MTDPALTLWAAARRDALLLTALALGVAAWAWSQESAAMAVGAVVCTLLYLLTVVVAKQGRKAEQHSPPLPGRGRSLVWWILPILTASATLIPLVAATRELFGQDWLTVAAAILTAAWQIWFYLWVDE